MPVLTSSPYRGTPPSQHLRLAITLATLGCSALANAASVTPTVHYKFPFAYQNSYAGGRLAQGGDGRIFIATHESSNLPCGSLLALNPASGVVSKVTLDRDALGCMPSETLNVDAQGTLWGSLSTKGPGKRGSLFRIPAGGSPTLAHAYTKSEGYAGGATPIPWADGSLRTVRVFTSQGSAGQFERNAAPAYQPELFRQVTANDGITSPHTLASRGDGFLYGLAVNIEGEQGGTSLFRVNDAGNLKVLARFYPYGIVNGDLVDGHDGSFYLTINSGDNTPDGSVLRVSPEGQTTVLHLFNGADGSHPTSAPIRAKDGWLYGTCATGGTHGQGVIYRLQPDGGSYEVLYHFDGEARGGWPHSGLLQASDGRLYGRASGGGAHHSGVVYSFSPPAP
ncbi:choice-of-anchor tandem repeat GloVer-containing protein [Ideonella sp.]|uniref:choice-of-anchor tandem repeat GloVer-containing protein n=1 Tax=Ideonella sp. TaxID=1929293 RepID=UPI0035B04181